MSNLRRVSPVQFSSRAAETEMRDNWEVVLKYQDEGDGPWLVDLSHTEKWDVQDSDLSRLKPCGLKIPENPGECNLSSRGILINRMNGTQASVWQPGASKPEAIPAEEPAYTNTTESTLMLAVIGKETFSIMEKVSALDFLETGKPCPCLIQGPVSHVPCQVVSLGEVDGVSAIIFTCSRGYGKSMTESMLHAGEEWHIRPAGEAVVSDFIKKMKSKK